MSLTGFHAQMKTSSSWPLRITDLLFGVGSAGSGGCCVTSCDVAETTDDTSTSIQSTKHRVPSIISQEIAWRHDSNTAK